MFKSLSTISLSVAAVMFAGAATAQMAAHGLVSAETYGFPATYTDQAGRSLIHGSDPTDPLMLEINGLADLANPNAPLSIEDQNFFHETFYWAGSTTLGTGVGESLLVMAVEGVFDNATEAIIDGDQLVFSRIRLRIDVANTPASAGTYTITHPFGTEVFEVDAATIAANEGRRVINWTDDCLHLDILNPSCAVGVNQFTNVMDPAIATISHFLEWDTGAPEGYLGDPNIGHAVVGSPTGNNFFRVEGPGIGLGATGSEITDDNAVQTSLFSIAGKIAEVDPTAWLDIGNGLAGSGGQPLLVGTGDLTPGSQFSVDLTNAPPLSLGILFVGAQAANLPFAGGIAVPDTSTGFRRQRFTNANGEISFGGAFPSPPPGTQFFVQYWIQDTGAPQNFTGSNAIVGTVP